MRSNIHHSEKSKSVSAGRPRRARDPHRLKDDLSFSSLSQTSRERKAEAHSFSKKPRNHYFVDAERYLKLLSPAGRPSREAPAKKNDLLHHSKPDSPHLKTVKSTGDDKKSSKMHPASLGDLTSGSKLHQTVKRAPNHHASSTDKPSKKQVTQELVKRYMEETQRKTEREVVHKQKTHELTVAQLKTKKKRPKSCYSKIGDGVFSAREP